MSVLQREFRRRREKNASYSLRSFARDLKISPSSLSDFFRGKKGLSQNSAKLIGRRIGLSQLQARLFYWSVLSSHAKSRSERSKAKTAFSELYSKKETFQNLKAKDLNELHSWICFSILELFELEGFEFDEKWIANRLGIKQRDVRYALTEMVRSNWLKHTQDGVVPTFHETEVETDVPSASVKRFHGSILKKANDAVLKDPIWTREFCSTIMAFNSKNLEEARSFLRDFQGQFIQKFYSPKDKKDSIYQFSFQLFRVDKG